MNTSADIKTRAEKIAALQKGEMLFIFNDEMTCNIQTLRMSVSRLAARRNIKLRVRIKDEGVLICRRA